MFTVLNVGQTKHRLKTFFLCILIIKDSGVDLLTWFARLFSRLINNENKPLAAALTSILEI